MNNQDYIADLFKQMQEICSSLLVLQQSVQNENSFITMKNIDDNLELILEYAKNTLKLIENLYENSD